MAYKCVVPVSGGKDSQSCLQLALERFPKEEILGLFCDTGFEHPLTYEHIKFLRNYYGVHIDTICAGDVLSESERWGRFPGGGSRHCTDYLKIRPTKEYIKKLAEKQGSSRKAGRSEYDKIHRADGGFEVWYGMRSDESQERKDRYEFKIADELYAPHEVMPSKYPKYLEKMGITFRLAVLDWTTAEVMIFLNGKHNPLYDEDFDRVGCFPCLASGDKAKEKAFNHDDFGRGQLAKVMVTSAKIGKSIWTSKGGKKRNAGAGCMVCGI